MVSISNLLYRRQYRNIKNKPGLSIIGFDTENKPGEPARVLCSNLEGTVIDSLQEGLKFLTRRQYSETLNVFWNLDYDVRSIFKYEFDSIVDLYQNKTIKYLDYEIFYIPGKLLRIKYQGHVYNYYDSYQYFNMKLETAVNKLLKKQVHELKGDRDKLFDMYKTETIIEYCISDSQLTKELTEFLLKGLEGLGFYPDNLLSVGSLAKGYCTLKSNIPKLNFLDNLPVIDAYYQAYRGGWFEIQKRGRLRVYGYDIVSAYPAITRELPDIRHGEFIEINKIEDIPESIEYGVIQVKAIQKRKENVNPLSILVNGALYYPYIDEPVIKWITLREYRTFTDLYEFEVLKGFYFKPFKKHYQKPFKKVIDELFKIKSDEKTAGRKGGPLYMASKLIMNSIYGNTIQTTKTEEGTITGAFFNPFYATEITAYCRCRIWDAIKNDLDSVIMIATDGVYTNKPLNLPESNELGGWECEYDNKDAIFLESGVYQIKGEPAKGRGIGKPDFYHVLRRNSNTLEFQKLRPVKTKEAIVQNRLEDINLFEVSKKVKKCTGDIRRNWNNEPVVFRELLTKKFISEPSELSFLKLFFGNKVQTNTEPFDPGEWLHMFTPMY